MANKQKNSETNITLKVAIVSAATTVVVAVVTGVFQLLQRQPSPTAMPQEIPTATSAPAEQFPVRIDVKRLNHVALPERCESAFFPAELDPVADPVFAYRELEARHWFDYPPDPTVQTDLPGRVFAEVTVTSLVNEEWVKLSNKIMVKVAHYEPLPGPMNITAAGGCGGGSWEEVFVNFQNSASTFSEVANENVDFFTLQPGEFEAFAVVAQTGEPGRYEVKFGVEYSYKGITSELWSEQTVSVLQPATMRTWMIDDLKDPPRLVHLQNIWYGDGTWQVYDASEPMPTP